MQGVIISPIWLGWKYWERGLLAILLKMSFLESSLIAIHFQMDNVLYIHRLLSPEVEVFLETHALFHDLLARPIGPVLAILLKINLL